MLDIMKFHQNDPAIIYLSHTDYEQQSVEKDLYKEFCKELRECLKIHPNLVYPLLAVITPLFMRNMDTSPFLFMFCNNENDNACCVDFIQMLVSVIYGNPADSMFNESKFNIRIHHNKSYYLNRMNLAFAGIEQEDAFLKNILDYESCNDFYNNSLIMTTVNPDKYYQLSDAVRNSILYFHTDLLNQNCKDDKKYSILKKFYVKCGYSGYHHFCAYLSRNMRRYSDNDMHSIVYLEFLEIYPHLKDKCSALFSAAEMIRSVFHCDISTHKLEQIILRNFTLATQASLVLFISDRLPAVNISNSMRKYIGIPYNEWQYIRSFVPIQVDSLSFNQEFSYLNSLRFHWPSSKNAKSTSDYASKTFEFRKNYSMLSAKYSLVNHIHCYDNQNNCLLLRLLDGDITRNL